jgi:FkbM family methyltransferase
MPPSLATLARATRVGLSAARTSEEERRANADRRAMALLIAALLERGDDAIDVGAHQGHLVQQILTAAPEGRHLAVEPLPNHALELRAALPSNVIIEEYALTEDHVEGEMEFLHIPRTTTTRVARTTHGAPAQDALPMRRLQVRTISLDALVDRHDLIPRLIRIDVDGSEGTVLAGARRTIQHYQPALLVEHGNSLCHGGLGQSSSSFFHQVSDLGLRIFDLDGHGPYDLDGFARAVTGRRIVNYLLRH